MNFVYTAMAEASSFKKTQIQQIPQNKSGEQRRPVVAIGLRYAMTADGPQYAMNKELDERGRKPGVDNA